VWVEQAAVRMFHYTGIFWLLMIITVVIKWMLFFLISWIRKLPSKQRASRFIKFKCRTPNLVNILSVLHVNKSIVQSSVSRTSNRMPKHRFLLAIDIRDCSYSRLKAEYSSANEADISSVNWTTFFSMSNGSWLRETLMRPTTQL
jgi:hypothetical protein